MEKEHAVKIIKLVGNTKLKEKTVKTVVDGNQMQNKLHSRSMGVKKNNLLW